MERCARGEIASVNCLVLDSSDGLTSLEMAGGNQPSACTTPDGRLWFATSGGLAMVEPARIRTNALPPPVRLEEGWLTESPWAAASLRRRFSTGPERRGGPRRAGSSHVLEARRAVLRVPPGSGQIELRYTALSFCAPQRVRFRYRLEKVDAEWVEAGARRSAYYSHLAPGKYRFQVIACNNDGVWNERGAAVDLGRAAAFLADVVVCPCCWLGGMCLVGTGVITTSAAPAPRTHRGAGAGSAGRTRAGAHRARFAR